MNLHGLKPVVSYSCIIWLFALLVDILFYCHFRNMAYRLGKIAISPKAISPKKLFQLWKFFADYLTCSTFQYTYCFSNAIISLQLYQQVHMVFLDTYLAYPPTVHPASIIQKPFQTIGYFASEYPLTILWYPHQMVLQFVPCMCTFPISGHSQIMPQVPSLSQENPGFARSPLLPRAKARGWSV